MNTYTTNFWDCSFPFGSGYNTAKSDNLYTLSELSTSLFTQEETQYTIKNGPPVKSNSLFFSANYSNSNCTGDKAWCGVCCNGTLQDNDTPVKLLSGDIAKNLIIGYSYYVNFFHSSDVNPDPDTDTNIYFGYCAVPTKKIPPPPKDIKTPTKDIKTPTTGNICDTLINNIEYGDILKLTSTINHKCPPIYLMAFDCCGTCNDSTRPNFRQNLDIAIPVADNGGAYTCLKKSVKDGKCNQTGSDEQCINTPNKESFCWAYDNTWSLNNGTFAELWNSKGGQSLSLGEQCKNYPTLMQIGCKNWLKLQTTYFKDNPLYGLAQQDPAETSPTKAWTYEVFKSGTKEFSDIFYNYYFKSFNKYYGETYTNLRAQKSASYYTGKITSDINFYNPSKSQPQINSLTISSTNITIGYKNVKAITNSDIPPPIISKGCIME